MVRYETPEVVGSSGTVPASGRLEAIRVPAAATDQGELLVTLEPSLADGLLDGLAYLQHYPYECNEQTVSRFLPNLFTVRAFAELGLDNKELEKDLAYQLGIGLQRLVNRQNGDGGWGYWSREESRPFISAYVLWGLWSADQMGYSVPPATLLNAIRYLDRSFVAPASLANNWQYNEMAFVHFVLAEMGQGDAGRMTTLFEVRERLDLYGKAYLAMAMADVGLTEQSNTLLDDLAGQVEISASGAMWAEGSVDWWNMNTDTRIHGHRPGRLHPSAPGLGDPAPSRALADERPPSPQLDHHPRDRLGLDRPDRLDGADRRIAARLQLDSPTQRRAPGQRQLHRRHSSRANHPAHGHHRPAAGSGQRPAPGPGQRHGPALLHHPPALLPGRHRGPRPGSGLRGRAFLRRRGRGQDRPDRQHAPPWAT